MRTIKEAKKQSAFCTELMKRIDETMQNAEVEYGRIKYHTQIENDVIRLRRELNTLHRMLMQYDYK